MPIATYFTFLCSEVWPSDRNILKINQNIPLLFLSSQKDELIPVNQQKELFQMAPMKSKMYAPVPLGTHNVLISFNLGCLDSSRLLELFCRILENLYDS